MGINDAAFYKWRQKYAELGPSELRNLKQLLSSRIREITQSRVHYGYRRVHVLLRRKRPRRNKAVQLRQPKTQASQINQIWSMDFVADNLFDRRKLRMLTVVDCYTHECLAIHVGQSLKGEDVAQVLQTIIQTRGQPKTIKSDNGSEFVGKVMDKWADERGIEMELSRPGKPTDNAMVESFNGRLSQACLNQHGFMSLDDAKVKIEAWRTDYNETRPHSALNWMSPNEFARSSPASRAASST
jgi:putative transposase